MATEIVHKVKITEEAKYDYECLFAIPKKNYRTDMDWLKEHFDKPEYLAPIMPSEDIELESEAYIELNPRIVPEEKASVPVAVWEIQPKDEQALDRYEGYPSYYRKEDIKVKMENGEEITAMVYIMNRGKPSLPSHSYFETIRQGYADVGLNLADLMKALEYTDLRR